MEQFRLLCERRGPEKSTYDLQDGGDVSKLLENIRETVYDYQVRP